MTGDQTIAAARAAAELRLQASGSDSPRLDAELLLAEITGLDRTGVIAHHDRALTDTESSHFEALVLRRESHEPVAYILRRAPFRRLELEVTPDVLIPRPETELLVDVALEQVAAMYSKATRGRDAGTPVRVLDIGTGSGAIAVATASEAAPGTAVVSAVDLSEEALAVARRNATRAGVTIEWLQGDLASPVAQRTFDLVLSNPPYLLEDEADTLMPDVVDHEPHLALFGGDTFLSRVVREAASLLAPGGTFAVEVAWDGADAMQQRLTDHGLISITRHRDLMGHERVVAGHAPSE